MSVHISDTGEYDWTAYLWQRCGLFVKWLWPLVCNYISRES